MENVKSMLKTGMRVILRDGSRFIVILNFCKDGKGYLYSEYNYEPLDNYDLCLKHYKFSRLDIIEIQQPESEQVIIPYCIKESNSFTTIWKREETKEMTVAEIEKELGYKVKIVDNENKEK